MLRSAVWLIATVLSVTTSLADPRLTPPTDRPLRVAIVVTDGANVMDIAGPWETFQDAMTPSGRQAFELFMVSDRKTSVTLTGGMVAVPHYTFAEAPQPDIVVVGAQRGAPEL